MKTLTTLIVLGLSIAPGAFAGIQSVRTNKAVFRSSGHVLTANGKRILDLREVSREGGGSAKITIVSAVGNVVSVTAETETCGATCETSQDTIAFQADGLRVPLTELVDEMDVLVALQADPFLKSALAEENPELLAQFQAARSVREATALLAAGFQMGEQRFSLGSEALDNFRIHSYDPATNRMKVRISMQQLISDDAYAGPELGLLLTPKPAFAHDLRAAKRGQGLFR